MLQASVAHASLHGVLCPKESPDTETKGTDPSLAVPESFCPPLSTAKVAFCRRNVYKLKENISDIELLLVVIMILIEYVATIITSWIKAQKENIKIQGQLMSYSEDKNY